MVSDQVQPWEGKRAVNLRGGVVKDITEVTLEGTRGKRRSQLGGCLGEEHFRQWEQHVKGPGVETGLAGMKESEAEGCPGGG